MKKIVHKIPIDFNQFNADDFLYEWSIYMKEKTGINDTPDSQVDVSCVWINESTYEIFKDKLLKQLTTMHATKRLAESAMPMTILQYAPAVDLYNDYDIPNNVMYIMEGFAVYPNKE